MPNQDISKVSVDQVLSKFSRYEYSLEDAAELIARLENTTDYHYMKRVVRETLKQAMEITGELSGRIVNGEYSIRHKELKFFSKKRGWRFGDDENEQQSKPQQQNYFSEHQINCLCIFALASQDYFSKIIPDLPEQKYKKHIQKLRAGKIPITQMLEILEDQTKDGSYKVLNNSTFRNVMTMARDRINFSENSEKK